MKLAIMQPYFFPYIGYFQLIHSVDTFLIYDDVNYIKNGWINRNRIVSKATGGSPVYFGLNLSGASSFKKIYDIKTGCNTRCREKLLKTIESCYGKSENFKEVFEIVKEVVMYKSDFVSEINSAGIKMICNYLDINTDIISTSRGIGSNDLSAEDRVIDICKKLKCKKYINAIGGTKLYSYNNFKNHDLKLGFVSTKKIDYEWWNLSILHLLMKFKKIEVLKMLNSYDII